jgi:hypothetical protein
VDALSKCIVNLITPKLCQIKSELLHLNHKTNPDSHCYEEVL